MNRFQITFGPRMMTLRPVQRGIVRIILVCAAISLSSPVLALDEDRDRLRTHLECDDYAIAWGSIPTMPPQAELEIGHGNGHGGTLCWIRFQPDAQEVDVLLIELDEGRQPYKSKWPPDRTLVAVKHARMKREAYATLLSDVAVVAAAKLQPIDNLPLWSSSNSFWVHARIVQREKTLVDLDWAGYEGSYDALKYGQPRAAVALARGAIKDLEFTEHTPTDDERAWASAKFARDWQKFQHLEFHWWVRERYIEVIGVVGDRGALPTLREILVSDPPKDGPRYASGRRSVYYAINAVTRLIQTDVRSKPVEEMEVENIRRKVLDLPQVRGE